MAACAVTSSARCRYGILKREVLFSYDVTHCMCFDSIGYGRYRGFPRPDVAKLMGPDNIWCGREYQKGGEASWTICFIFYGKKVIHIDVLRTEFISHDS